MIVFARSDAVIVDSNPASGMDVSCVRLFCVCVVLCVGRGLATGWSPVQVVLPTVQRSRKWSEHYAQLSDADLIVTCSENRLAMAHWECFTHAFNVVLGDSAAWCCFFHAFVLLHQRSVICCCLVRVHLIKLTLNTDARFKRYQQLNTIHFLRYGVNWSKLWRGVGIPYAHAHGKWLEQAGTNMEIFHTIWKCSQPNVCFHSIFRAGLTVVVPCVIKGYDFILRRGDVMPILLEINYKFCTIEYIRWTTGWLAGNGRSESRLTSRIACQSSIRYLWKRLLTNQFNDTESSLALTPGRRPLGIRRL
jgi:hypothetical protein